MTRRSLTYYFKSALKPFLMVFGAFSLNKQSMKELRGSATCDSDVKAGPHMTHRSIAYYFRSALKSFSMVFGAFSLYKQNTKEPWGSVTCDSDEG